MVFAMTELGSGFVNARVYGLFRVGRPES